ncbi:hypothetical protein ONZ45_g5150 [Pleurotus djamor]|nr:hypothetical protein ONZ45_g5150 [Pleurotus djamor]
MKQVSSSVVLCPIINDLLLDQAYSNTARDYLASKIIMSKRLLESVVLCRRGKYPNPKDVLLASPTKEFPFQVPSPPTLHIPSHILVYDIGRRLTTRYSSTSWDDVRSRVLEDYPLQGEIYQLFMRYCFEIYHVWMKAEPSEEWLSIPLPPRPGDALGFAETVCHFDDAVAVDPLDSSSNYKPPSDCSSFKSSDDKEVYVTDQWYASATTVVQWAQIVAQSTPENLSNPSCDDDDGSVASYPASAI